MDNSERVPHLKFDANEQELREFLEQVKRDFSFDDLKSLFEDPEGVPAAEVIDELEGMARDMQNKRARG